MGVQRASHGPPTPTLKAILRASEGLTHGSKNSRKHEEKRPQRCLPPSPPMPPGDSGRAGFPGFHTVLRMYSRCVRAAIHTSSVTTCVPATPQHHKACDGTPDA